MTKDIILCKCHKQPVKSEVVKGKAFGKKYSCEVTGDQLLSNEFIYGEMKVDLPDDTWSGDDVSPADVDDRIDDYKKRQGGDE